MGDWRENDSSNQGVRERLARVETIVDGQDANFNRLERVVAQLTETIEKTNTVLIGIQNTEAYRRGAEHQKTAILATGSSMFGAALTVALQKLFHL